MAGDWKVNAGRLWAVGATTAVIAGLAAAIVWLFATQVFDETLYVTSPGGSDLVELSVGQTFIAAFIAGILATGAMHLMLAFVPRGSMFFGLLATLVLFGAILSLLVSFQSSQAQENDPLDLQVDLLMESMSVSSL